MEIEEAEKISSPIPYYTSASSSLAYGTQGMSEIVNESE